MVPSFVFFLSRIGNFTWLNIALIDPVFKGACILNYRILISSCFKLWIRRFRFYYIFNFPCSEKIKLLRWRNFLGCYI